MHSTAKPFVYVKDLSFASYVPYMVLFWVISLSNPPIVLRYHLGRFPL